MGRSWSDRFEAFRAEVAKQTALARALLEGSSFLGSRILLRLLNRGVRGAGELSLLDLRMGGAGSSGSDGPDAFVAALFSVSSSLGDRFRLVGGPGKLYRVYALGLLLDGPDSPSPSHLSIRCTAFQEFGEFESEFFLERDVSGGYILRGSAVPEIVLDAIRTSVPLRGSQLGLLL